MKPTHPITATIESHWRTLASILSVILLANTFVVVQTAITSPAPEPSAFATDLDGSTLGADPAKKGTSKPSTVATATKTKAARQAAAIRKAISSGKGGQYVKGLGTIPNGINGNELTVVYYWKGDQTKASPFLAGSGQEGNVDEGLAFKALIKFINKHADGGELMGYKFNLHGWKLKPIVLEAGKGDDQIRAAQKIAHEIKPFAAVSSHGSISAYVCPTLAKAKIPNISTYDLDWGLTEKTNGFCLPQGLSWGAQVDLTIAYLKAESKANPLKRYGLLYAEYPGLVNSGPKLYDMLKKAGIPVVAKKTVDPDLTTAGRQQPGVIADFQAKGVNTILAPDSGSLITFTHAAQAATYAPDYYVWPCSGEDALGMTRLYNASQWRKASGLTCYDKELNADLTNDSNSPKTEWYKAYKEGDAGEPPAPTALVYQSLLPLLVGLTHAGKTLTLERWMEGQKTVTPYRYDAIDGRTKDGSNILVTTNQADGSQVGDCAKVVWDETVTTPGNPAPGTYVFPEKRRYRRGATF